jgi:hypothetical protein
MFTYLFGFGWLQKKIKLSYQMSLTWNTNNFLFSKVSFVFFSYGVTKTSHK